MFSWLTNAWRVPELRRRVIFTAVILALYRLGSWIPAPGIDSESIQTFFNTGGRGQGVFGLLNTFSGSALSRFSIFALGIMPYITASIILQLMTVVVPTLEQLQKEGEAGYAKINQYTRYLTVALAAAQSLGYAFLFKKEGVLEANAGRLVLIVAHADRGNGAADVDGRADHEARDRQRHLAAHLRVDPLDDPGGDHRVDQRRRDREALPARDRTRRHRRRRLHPGRPAADPGSVRRSEWSGRKMTAGGSTYMPLRVNMAGVIPIIFAAAVMAFPPTIASFFPTTQSFINNHFQYGSIQYLGIEALLIVVFTYFYTAVQFNPVDQADNLRKYGGYIPGIRPGPPTAQYLDRVLSRLTLPGSIYLALVAVLPGIFIYYFHFSNATSRALGGTSVIIVVGVALDTMRQMESQMMMRSYEGFLK